jgi:hypothetical protein
VLRLTSQRYKGATRIHLREFYRPDPGAELRPTTRGAWFGLAVVPALRVALEQIERETVLPSPR